MTLFVIFNPYHFVRTILSMPFCPIPFCLYTILSIPFCPYHFVRYHFVLEPHPCFNSNIHLYIYPCITACIYIYIFIHSFIHSGHFYSAPSSPLLLRGAPDYSTDTVSEFHSEAHRQLQVK